MATNPHEPKTGIKTTPHLGQINQIARWFDAAIPTPSDQNAHTRIGVHFEEVFEMAQTLKVVGATYSSRQQLNFASDVLSYFQKQIKSGALEMDLSKVDRVALLDSLCDQIVTTVGIAHMLGMDIEGALQAVADSNDSKFGEDRKPVFDKHRKIMKGPRYRSPDLAPFATRE